MFGDLFGSPFGCVIDPQQQRALSAVEITAIQAAQANMVMQAQPKASFAFEQLFANWQCTRSPERPLDERFADFKVRLAAAIARQRVKRGGEGYDGAMD